MKKIIFISGTSRSGSSLLDMMLGNSPEGFSAGELHALFRPQQPRHLLNNIGCFCNDKQCNFWSEIKKKGESNVYDNIFKHFKNINFIVDSSKRPLWIRDQMRYNEYKKYKIYNIIIFKTPLEYAYSRHKRNKLKNWDKTWIKRYSHLLSIAGDFITVKYQELATNPSKKLQNLCERIGIDYFLGKENFWENNFKHLLFGSQTLRNSEKSIFYREQYDKDVLDFLKKNVNLKSKKIEDVLSILEEFEVDSKKQKNISDIKFQKRTQKFTFITVLIRNLSATPFYRVNQFVLRLKGLFSKFYQK